MPRSCMASTSSSLNGSSVKSAARRPFLCGRCRLSRSDIRSVSTLLTRLEFERPMLKRKVAVRASPRAIRGGARRTLHTTNAENKHSLVNTWHDLRGSGIAGRIGGDAATAAFGFGDHPPCPLHASTLLALVASCPSPCSRRQSGRERCRQHPYPYLWFAQAPALRLDARACTCTCCACAAHARALTCG